MDQDLYQKLMLEPEVLQGIGAVALREAEKEVKKQEQDSARKNASDTSVLLPWSFDHAKLYGDLKLPNYPVIPRSHDERRREQVRNCADEIFKDYISRLDLLEKFKKSGYRFMDELGCDDKNTHFVYGNHGNF